MFGSILSAFARNRLPLATKQSEALFMAPPGGAEYLQGNLSDEDYRRLIEGKIGNQAYLPGNDHSQNLPVTMTLNEFRDYIK